MANLDIWNALSRPPQEALKRITGGRLNGMTDISPQWRLKAMTEQFGPVGTGWGYSIERLWTEPGSDGQVCAFAQVNVWYEDSKLPITGVGGSMLVTNQQNGAYTSDEAYKMAVTDALSVAFKSIGVAADIYMGLWDGSKYKDAPANPNGPSKADLLYTDLRKRIDAEVEAVKRPAAVSWLDGFAKTETGMKAAKAKFDARMAEERPEPDTSKGKAEIAETVARMAGKAEDDKNLEIF